MVTLNFSLLDVEYILLIIVRIASFFFVAPFFSQKGVPAQLKVGLSFFLAIILFNAVPHPEQAFVGTLGYAVAVIKEALVGLFIGFAAYICNSIVIFAGNIIDMDIGLSMMQEYNPQMSAQTTATGNLYYYIIFALLIATGMDRYLLRVACDSFYVVPIGGAVFEWDNLLLAMGTYMADLFVIGFRIFLPIFAVMMVMSCILGVMTKVAPQMNMFSIGIQLKILVGFLVLFLMICLFPSVSDAVFSEMKKIIVLFVEGMS